MNKKAQEARNDLMMWYAVCFAIVFISLLSLYGLGIVGSGDEPGSLIGSNKITAAAVAVPVDEPDTNIKIVVDTNSSGENE
ncbi:hypothetical protein KY332_03070 [Candidatus Woesearchaeota archaeon]|nr:hypothetical protein [Candidatus Woesearchaeota archaeon]